MLGGVHTSCSHSRLKRDYYSKIGRCCSPGAHTGGSLPSWVHPASQIPAGNSCSRGSIHVTSVVFAESFQRGSHASAHYGSLTLMPARRLRQRSSRLTESARIYAAYSVRHRGARRTSLTDTRRRSGSCDPSRFRTSWRSGLASITSCTSDTEDRLNIKPTLSNTPTNGSLACLIASPTSSPSSAWRPSRAWSPRTSG